MTEIATNTNDAVSLNAASENVLGWAQRVHASGEFTLTKTLEFAASVEAAWKRKGRTKRLNLAAKLRGRESGKGMIPKTMTHPETKVRFVFPIFKLEVPAKGKQIVGTPVTPRCTDCGGDMVRSPATDKRPEAFICAPCKKALNAFEDVRGTGKPRKPRKKVGNDDREAKLRDARQQIARVLHIVEVARKVVEDRGFSLPIGVRTTKQLAALAVIFGSADEAWRLWLNGRIPSQWRESFDAAGLPAGDPRWLVNDDENNPSWYATAARVLDAGMPIFLVGPAGSGKTYFAKWYAEQREKDIEICVGSGDLAGQQLWIDQVSAKNGSTTVHRGPAARACTDGSVLLLDEVDGFDPNSLLPMNAVLNGDRQLAIPVLGKLDINEEVRIVAAANTTGLSRDRTYTARNKLDGAFLNRFAVVIHAGYEPAVDRKVAEDAVLDTLEILAKLD